MPLPFQSFPRDWHVTNNFLSDSTIERFPMNQLKTPPVETHPDLLRLVRHAPDRIVGLLRDLDLRGSETSIRIVWQGLGWSQFRQR